MSDAIYPLDPVDLTISNSLAKDIGARLAPQYQGKQPYDYGCFDNFLPIEVLERVREEVLALGSKDPEHSSGNERLKTSFNPDALPAYTKAVFHALNSRAFIQFLEQMSGIKGLIPDPYYFGGGIHRTENTGFLSIHADFNHHSLMAAAAEPTDLPQPRLERGLRRIVRGLDQRHVAEGRGLRAGNEPDVLLLDRGRHDARQSRAR